MSMIVWILLGLGLGLIASKLVSTTGEGTIVDILLGIVGAIIGGWLFDVFGGAGVTGFNIDSSTAPVPLSSAPSFFWSSTTPFSGAECCDQVLAA